MIPPPRWLAFSGGPIPAGTRFPLWWALLALLVAVLLVAEIVDEDPHVYPDPVGTRIQEPLRVVLIMDDSGSTLQTDPDGRRYEAAQAMVEFLTGLGLPDQSDVVHVVHFAGTASADPPLRLSSPNPGVTGPRRNLSRGTSIVAGIRAANKIAAQPFEGKTVAILFTDGQVDSAELATIGRTVEQLPSDAMHLVGLGNSPNLDVLKTAPFASVVHLDGVDSNTLKDMFGRIVVEELGMKWGSQWSASWESQQLKWGRRADRLMHASAPPD